VFPICWLIAVFLPCCDNSRANRRAALGSGIMLGLYAAAVAIAVGVSVSAVVAAAARSPDCRRVDEYIACFDRDTGLATLRDSSRQLGEAYMVRNDFEDLDWAGMRGSHLRAIFPMAP
jgi:hypothetical protein